MPNNKRKSKGNKSPENKESDEHSSPQKTRLTGEKRKNIVFNEIKDAASKSPIKSPSRKSKRLEDKRVGNTSISTDSNSVNNNAILQDNNDNSKEPKKLNSDGAIVKCTKVAESKASQTIVESLDWEYDKGAQTSGQTTRPQEGDGLEIVTEVQAEEDNFPAEDSSDEEESGHRFRRDGRRVIERQFPQDDDNTIDESELSEDEVMSQISKNPKLWALINGMVNKIKNNSNAKSSIAGSKGKSKVTGTPKVAAEQSKGGKQLKPRVLVNKSPSDTTIYTPALKLRKVQEMVKSPVTPTGNKDDLMTKISDFVEQVRRQITPPEPEQPDVQQQVHQSDEDEPHLEEEADPDAYVPPEVETGHDDNVQRARARDLTERAIIEAEKHKARVATPQGKVPAIPVVDVSGIDNQLMLICSHIEEEVKQKIRNGEYVDLEKLLPKKQGMPKNEDYKMNLTSAEGMNFWLPCPEKTKRINSIKRWDEAFRVYASIYAEANPTRGKEVWQYMHTIHSAHSTFHLDNVLFYDCEFRRVMHQHPERSWAVLNTQLWSISMRDPLPTRSQGGAGVVASGNSSKAQGGKDLKEICCWKYNRNKCNRTNCHYEHRCSYCGSPSHIFFGCPKRSNKNKGGEGHGAGDNKTQGGKPAESNKTN